MSCLIQLEPLFPRIIQEKKTNQSNKVFLSKDWTSQLCIFPEMAIPPTTKVSRCAFERDPLGASRKALQALVHLTSTQEAKKTETSAAGLSGPISAGKVFPGGVPNTRGVAKLGYSWEANDGRRRFQIFLFLFCSLS